jgi:hypothetical protein
LSAGWRSPSRSAIKSRAAFPQGARKAGLYLVVLSCLVSEPEAVANGLSVVAGFEVNVQDLGFSPTSLETTYVG